MRRRVPKNAIAPRNDHHFYSVYDGGFGFGLCFGFAGSLDWLTGGQEPVSK